MSGKAPGEQHHHSAPMLYAAPPQHAAGAGAAGSPGGNVLGMGELMRKKRGRPRKYAPNGSMALALAPISSASAGGAAAPGQQQHGGFSISSPPSDPNAKRRGRPPGSGKKKQFEALGSWGIAFTPHILTVKAGERPIKFWEFMSLILEGLGYERALFPNSETWREKHFSQSLSLCIDCFITYMIAYATEDTLKRTEESYPTLQAQNQRSISKASIFVGNGNRMNLCICPLCGCAHTHPLQKQYFGKIRSKL